MNESLDNIKYRTYVTRKTPCIIYFEDENDEFSKKLVLNMDKLCEEFKLVLCYKVDWKKSKLLQIPVVEHTSWDILSFHEGTVTKKVSAISEKEVRNLFKTVFNDCIRNFLPIYKRLLKREKYINFKEDFVEYFLDTPSYNINRNKFKRLYIRKSNKNSKEKNIQNLDNSDNKTRKISFPVPKILKNRLNNGIVPVKKGLPKIDVFLIPLNILPVSEYFESQEDIFNFRYDTRQNIRRLVQRFK